MRRPCERTWNILEWAWGNKIEEFTNRGLLDRGVASYSGTRRKQIWFASSTLRRMHEAGLLTHLAAGKGRRAGLYVPITREGYERKLRQMVLI